MQHTRALKIGRQLNTCAHPRALFLVPGRVGATVLGRKLVEEALARA